MCHVPCTRPLLTLSTREENTSMKHAPSLGKISAAAHASVKGVRGVIPLHPKKVKALTWRVASGARSNYRRLGRRLAEASDRLYRNGIDGYGLIHITEAGDDHLITKGCELAPVLVDNVVVRV